MCPAALWCFREGYEERLIGGHDHQGFSATHQSSLFIGACNSGLGCSETPHHCYCCLCMLRVMCVAGQRGCRASHHCHSYGVCVSDRVVHVLMKVSYGQCVMCVAGQRGCRASRHCHRKMCGCWCSVWSGVGCVANSCVLSRYHKSSLLISGLPIINS